MDINIRLQPKNPGNPPTYVCDYCDYNTSSRKDFDKHILTKKHIYNKYNKSTTQTTSHHNTGYTCVCMCGKSYNHRASLYNHKKKCIMCKEGGNETMDKSVNNGLLEESFGDGMVDGMGENTIVGDKLNITTDMFMKLMNDNQEMIKIIKEQQHQINAIIPKIGNGNGNVTTNNNMTTNMTNNNFNLNFFLNEKCKDALNM